MKYLPLIFLLSSCVTGYHHAIVDGTRREETDVSAQWGAVVSQKGADGYALDADAQKNADSLIAAGGLAIGAIENTKSTVSNNGVTMNSQNQATIQNGQKLKAQTSQLKTAGQQANVSQALKNGQKLPLGKKGSTGKPPIPTTVP